MNSRARLVVALCFALVAPCLSGQTLRQRAASDRKIANQSSTARPRKLPYDHILLIMLENVGYNNVIGSRNAPYINKRLLAQGTLYTNSFGVSHPSLPNYLTLFSGSTLGVNNDNCIAANPPNGPFNAPNLYSELKKMRKTALGYMESLPYDGYTGCSANGYVQKHNPFMFFNAGTSNRVPPSASVVYNGPYPATAQWPNFAMICPNEQHDMHNGATDAIKVRDGDAWLSQHLPPLITFARNNNGLMIVTMDESSNQHVPTILVGAGIAAGTRASPSITHYKVIKTVLENFALPSIGDTAGLPDLSEVTP